MVSFNLGSISLKSQIFIPVDLNSSKLYRIFKVRQVLPETTVKPSLGHMPRFRHATIEHTLLSIPPCHGEFGRLYHREV